MRMITKRFFCGFMKRDSWLVGGFEKPTLSMGKSGKIPSHRWVKMGITTVDGPPKSESLVDRWFIPLFIGFQPSFWWCRISQPSTAVHGLWLNDNRQTKDMRSSQTWTWLRGKREEWLVTVTKCPFLFKDIRIWTINWEMVLKQWNVDSTNNAIDGRRTPMAKELLNVWFLVRWVELNTYIYLQ